MRAMDAATGAALAALMRRERIAALGTLREGAPDVSMVAYLPEADFAALWLRISRLAWHTQDLRRDARASLAVLQADDGRADPQTLARVTLRGVAAELADGDTRYARLKADWLARFPESAVTFELADFSFWSIAVRDARFVAGLGRTHNLSAPDLLRAAQT
ncbi:MAG: pyridoxamine 5'-phosphate oxidase family protein [Betaproteobacteria bacterium]|nr:MAG: pyridoxamine 5'-phosphate oxidase family protein [Betaproteobacteria bacterium]